MVDYRNVDLYWGRCGREWDNRSLRWDAMVGNGVVDPYRGRRECHCISLLGTE